jgi:triosephosphate isomerase
MAATRRPLVAGNWKMNGLKGEGVERVRALRALVEGQAPACDVLVCPPATLIARVVEALQDSAIAVGGQDCHAEDKGAFTGDVAAPMLKDAGCGYVIVGHSERRRDHAEADAKVKAKAEAALRASLVPIVCLGESEAEREGGQTDQVVGRQLRDSLPSGAMASNVVIAYEPIWAIGTGKTATEAQIGAVHEHLRTVLGTAIGAEAEGVRLLYGGSVNARNAAAILAIRDVDGALVGGASLKVDEFWAICRSCARA